MKFRHFLASAALFFSCPALTATVILQPEGPDNRAGFQASSFLGDGVYLARFTFDKAAQPGSLLTFVYNVSYDFFGVEDGIHYGGDDVPTYSDHYFSGPRFATLLRVERPYQSIDYWGGDVGHVEERGLYYVDAILGEFSFPSAGPVRLDYSIERISAVPEPGSWVMMIVGLGVVGWFWRRRSGSAHFYITGRPQT